MNRTLGAMVAVTLGICLAMGVAVALASQINIPLMADAHEDAGLDCEACHVDDDYDEVGMDTCLDCHGPYEHLAELTAGVHLNPHDSHYLDLDCNLCHHGHQPSEDFCSTCHEPAVSAERHIAVGVGCRACHGSGKKTAEVESDRCLSCHGPREALAEKTKDVEGDNPHGSYHDELDCTMCHASHEVYEVDCSSCH